MKEMKVSIIIRLGGQRGEEIEGWRANCSVEAVDGEPLRKKVRKGEQQPFALRVEKDRL